MENFIAKMVLLLNGMMDIKNGGLKENVIGKMDQREFGMMVLNFGT
jgi:hypothetical protein